MGKGLDGFDKIAYVFKPHGEGNIQNRPVGFLEELAGLSYSQAVKIGYRCYNSPSLIKHIKRLLEAMTGHYSKNPAVIGWQTDNEFWTGDCHYENCNNAFRSWVMEQLSGTTCCWNPIARTPYPDIR